MSPPRRARPGQRRLRPDNPPSYLDNRWQYELERYVAGEFSPRSWFEWLTSFRRAAEEAAADLPHACAELRSLLDSVDPIAMYGAMDVYDAMRRSHMPGPANFGSDAMVELMAGFVVSSDEISMLPRIDERFDPWLVQECDALLQRIANLRYLASTAKYVESDPKGGAGLRRMIELEHNFDRMAGFDPHVRRVAVEVLGRVDDRAKVELGFKLTESLRFAHLYNQVRIRHARRTDAYLAEAYPSPAADEPPAVQESWMVGHFVLWALNANAPLEGGVVDEALAENLGLDPDAFQSVIASLSTRVGTVEPDQIHTDNPVRVRPIVKLSSGEWMWPRPVDFVHVALEWAHGAVTPHPRLVSALDKARQRTAEDLTEELLREVFGERVYRSVTYPVEQSDAEVDVLVRLPGALLVVECKGGRISREGRRGAPHRVDRHIKDIVERANDQNGRTIRAIRDGAPFVDARGRSLDLDANSVILPITVTLDRVDPFGAYLGFADAESGVERSWIISLADLIMLAELLPSPSDFVAYVAKRRQMLRDEVLVYVEADALGAWFEDRLSSIAAVSDPHNDRVTRLLRETSEWMNDYYAIEALRRSDAPQDEVDDYLRDHPMGGQKPATRLPSAVIRSLDGLLQQEDPTWLAATCAALEVRPSAWKPVRRLLDAVDGGPPTGRRKSRQMRRAASGYEVDGRVTLTIDVASTGELSLQVAPTRQGLNVR
ncbi:MULTISPECIES: nuclease-related domain-containing protein [unclassified Nocardioides]|uniref:nuclease-related domain-containing protein n=1 Tax=unclassified Nocardioides TaxID=2615069 RepID=UPI000703AF04|nr:MULTISPECIES: nuclease-related domain-containing protein [unclassified Nocardioides]KRC46427.1 hypothetical protein ASE19_21610 [Nocardioides sp. Root79]KRC69772.1 hypothetical protein ASE20_14470 [Nocardioides sp. Root240]